MKTPSEKKTDASATFAPVLDYSLGYVTGANTTHRIVRPQSVADLTAKYINILWDDGSHKYNVRSFLGEIDEILKGVRFTGFDQAMLDSVIGSLRERGNSNATINRKMAALSKLLRKAYKMGKIYSLPEFIRQKERAGRIRFLEHEEKNGCLPPSRHAARTATASRSSSSIPAAGLARPSA